MPYPPQHHCYGYTLEMTCVLPPFGVFLNSALSSVLCLTVSVFFFFLCLRKQVFITDQESPHVLLAAP